MVRLSCAVFAVLVACGPTRLQPSGDASGSGDAGSPDAPVLPHTLSSIAITPTNPIVQLDLNATGTQAFTVMGSYEDGTTDDVTSQASWSVNNSAVGTMTGATLSIPAFATVSAEVSQITANVGSLTTEAQITVVAYRQTGTQQDFFFVLPYQDLAGPQKKPLDFSTAIPALDVFFLMDTTGSMQGEIGNLQDGADDADDRRDRLDPGERAELRVRRRRARRFSAHDQRRSVRRDDRDLHRHDVGKQRGSQRRWHRRSTVQASAADHEHRVRRADRDR